MLHKKDKTNFVLKNIYFRISLFFIVFCEVIVCDEPEVPHGSFVTGYDFTVGSEIQYHCEEGHKMIGGHEIRRCTNIGEWSGTPPECKCTAYSLIHIKNKINASTCNFIF